RPSWTDRARGSGRCSSRAGRAPAPTPAPPGSRPPPPRAGLPCASPPPARSVSLPGSRRAPAVGSAANIGGLSLPFALFLLAAGAAPPPILVSRQLLASEHLAIGDVVALSSDPKGA